MENILYLADHYGVEESTILECIRMTYAIHGIQIDAYDIADCVAEKIKEEAVSDDSHKGTLKNEVVVESLLLQTHPSDIGPACSVNKQFHAICMTKHFQQKYLKIHGY